MPEANCRMCQIFYTLVNIAMNIFYLTLYHISVRLIRDNHLTLLFYKPIDIVFTLLLLCHKSTMEIHCLPTFPTIVNDYLLKFF